MVTSDIRTPFGKLAGREILNPVEHQHQQSKTNISNKAIIDEYRYFGSFIMRLINF